MPHDPTVCTNAVKLIHQLGARVGKLPPRARERITLLHDRIAAHHQDGKPLTIAAADLDVLSVAMQSAESVIDLQRALEYLEPLPEGSATSHDGRRE